MDRVLFWLVRWPWLWAVAVLLGLTQLPLGPWYVSAWLGIGVALLVMMIARAKKLQLLAVMIPPAGAGQPVRPPAHQAQPARP